MSVKPFDDRVKVAMLERSIWADFVHCGNCGEFMLVNTGEESCPLCGLSGCLGWANEEYMEVEILDEDYFGKNLFRNAESLRCFGFHH